MGISPTVLHYRWNASARKKLKLEGHYKLFYLFHLTYHEERARWVKPALITGLWIIRQFIGLINMRSLWSQCFTRFSFHLNYNAWLRVGFLHQKKTEMLYNIGNGKFDHKKPRDVYFFSGVAAHWQKTVAAVSVDMHVFRYKLETNTRFSLTTMQPIFNFVLLRGNHLGFQHLRLGEYIAKLRENLV